MKRKPVKRKRRRRRSHEAWVTLQDGHTRVECRIVDVSQDGAQIICSRADALQDRFELAYALTASNSRTCAIVWRRGKTLGLKYTDQPPALTRQHGM
jgi:PilZ domain